MLRAFSIALTIGLFLSALGDLLVAQQNWSRFRGPNGTGLALDAQLPTEWNEDDYDWSVDLPGSGSSSPVIWEDRLFLTSYDATSNNLILQCLDANSGEEKWRREFPQDPYRMHKRNSYASATPCVDAERVYLTYANPRQTILVALTHDGEPAWERDFGRWISQHGFSASPIVYRDKVLFFNSQQAQRLPAGVEPGASRMIAVNADDGTDVWTASLTPTRACYAIPAIFTDDNGLDQLISCNTGDGFFSLDPESGKRNWAVFPFRQRTVASTLVADGLVIGSNGSGGGGNYLVAIRPDSKSIAQAPSEVYNLRKANYVPTPVAVNGLLFYFTDRGIGNCVDVQTGQSHWSQRLSSGFSGSPVATDSAIYVMDEDGRVLVIGVDDQFKLLNVEDLGESSRATPAIASGKIYFRTESKLFCLAADDH